MAVTDFTSKRSHLSLQFLETLFGRYPLLCAGFVESLQPLVTEGSLGNYKRLELVALLTGLLQHARGGPLQQTVGVLRGYREPLEAVRAWAQDKLEHRAEEGYEDFRKQPRRKVLNDFCRALEALMAEKAPKKAKKEEKGVEKKGEEKKGVERRKRRKRLKLQPRLLPRPRPRQHRRQLRRLRPRRRRKNAWRRRRREERKRSRERKRSNEETHLPYLYDCYSVCLHQRRYPRIFRAWILTTPIFKFPTVRLECLQPKCTLRTLQKLLA